MLHVSPCITLGLLLVASLSARAAGVPCEFPAFLQRTASPTQLSASPAGAASDRELLTLLGLDSVFSAPVQPQTDTSCCGFPSGLLDVSITENPRTAPAQPRAP
jgi:hypothetical protein